MQHGRGTAVHKTAAAQKYRGTETGGQGSRQGERHREACVKQGKGKPQSRAEAEEQCARSKICTVQHGSAVRLAQCCAGRLVHVQQLVMAVRTHAHCADL